MLACAPQKDNIITETWLLLYMNFVLKSSVFLKGDQVNTRMHEIINEAAINSYPSFYVRISIPNLIWIFNSLSKLSKFLINNYAITKPPLKSPSISVEIDGNKCMQVS